VGREFCAYFDLQDAGDLARRIDALQRHGSLPGVAAPHAYRPVDWSESSRDFVDQALRTAAAIG
jgi:hypothetical protein